MTTPTTPPGTELQLQSKVPSGTVLTDEDWGVRFGDSLLKYLNGEVQFYDPDPDRRTQLDYTPGFKDEYLLKLYQHMAAGKSYDSFGGRLGIGPGTKKRFEALLVEWRMVKEFGDMVCREFWETMGIDIAKGVLNGNASVYNNMIASLWRDAYGKQSDVRHELSLGGKMEVSIQEHKGIIPLKRNDETFTDAEVL